MPFLEIMLAEGRSPELKRELLAAVHRAVVDTLGVPDGNVRIVLREVPLDHWSSGGKTLAELRGPAQSAP